MPPATAPRRSSAGSTPAREHRWARPWSSHRARSSTSRERHEQERILIRVLIAYVVCFAAAGAWLAWGPSTDKLWLDTLIADLIATLVIFGFSRGYKNSSFYDAYWSVVPPAIFIYWWIETDAEGARLWLVLLVIIAWAIRLTGNWIYNWPGMEHEDWRYPMLKENAGKNEAVGRPDGHPRLPDADRVPRHDPHVRRRHQHRA